MSRAPPLVGLEVPDARTHRFRFPDTDPMLGRCAEGPSAGCPRTAEPDCAEGVPCDLGSDDGVGFTGPANIAETPDGVPCPCVAASEEGLLACVADFFRASRYHP